MDVIKRMKQSKIDYNMKAGLFMKILGISDSCDLFTGFGTQSLLVLEGFLKKGIEVEQLGWFKQESVVHHGIKIHPMGEYGDLDKVLFHCNRFKPDIIWSLGDLHMISYMLTAPEELRKRWMHWLPIDAEPYPYMMHESMQQVPNLVLMAEFAEKMCKKPLPNSIMIPHGLDPSVYKPLQNKHQMRIKNKVDDKFVVVTVMRNQWRKNLDLAVESFARFSKDKNDVIFIIHSQLAAPPKLRGWYLHNLIQINKDDWDPKLHEKIKMSANSLVETQMNAQYNIADVFFLTSSGEGFGVPTIEAQMTGLPVLVPNNTTGPEFTVPGGVEENRTGECIDIAINMIQGDCGVKRAMISPQAAANKLDKFYQSWKRDKVMLGKYGENGRRNAVAKYHYQIVIDKWHKAVMDLNARIQNPYESQTYTDTATFDIDKPLGLEEL